LRCRTQQWRIHGCRVGEDRFDCDSLYLAILPRVESVKIRRMCYKGVGDMRHFGCGVEHFTSCILELVDLMASITVGIRWRQKQCTTDTYRVNQSIFFGITPYHNPNQCSYNSLYIRNLAGTCHRYHISCLIKFAWHSKQFRMYKDHKVLVRSILLAMAFGFG
jgi:hypothetical protein